MCTYIELPPQPFPSTFSRCARTHSGLILMMCAICIIRAYRVSMVVTFELEIVNKCIETCACVRFTLLLCVVFPKGGDHSDTISRRGYASFTHQSSYYAAQPPTHLPTHSLTHSLTHLPTQPWCHQRLFPCPHPHAVASAVYVFAIVSVTRACLCSKWFRGQTRHRCTSCVLGMG